MSSTPAASGIVTSSESGGSAISGGEICFRNRSDLLPDNLTKQATPLEFITWLDKFRFWISASFGSFNPESASVAIELKMKLDSDWTSSLKSILNRDVASYKEIVEGIQKELLTQHPTLTRRSTLFSMVQEKG